MKKLPLLLLLWLDCSLPADAQNLVPNPSFEGYNSCPTAFTQINFSPGYTQFTWVQSWVNALQTTSPDYFNACAPTMVSVPQNTAGNQPGHSGQAYVGLAAWISSSNFREYVECKLSQAMVGGHTYHLSFYLSNSGYPGGGSAATVAGVDMVGACFTNAQIAVPAPGSPFLTNTPSVLNPGNFVTDTVGWTKVKGYYTAAGGEQWLTLGHFSSGNPVNYVIVAQGTSIIYCYYYLDDVSVHDLDAPDLIRNHDTFSCALQFPMTLQGPAGGDEYKWSTGASTAAISIAGPGTYWVRTWRDTTYYVDTFRVHTSVPYTLHLPADTNVCSGLPLTIAPDHAYTTYQWSTGAGTPSITVSQSGQYILTATDSCGVQKDTINVYYPPKLKLPADTLICNGGQITVGANPGFVSYSWSTGANTPSITISQSGQYIVTATGPCGPQKDTIKVAIRPPVPLPLTRDTTLCKGVTAPHLFAVGDSLRWYLPPSNTGSFVQPLINTSATGSQTVFLTQTKGGCEGPRQPLNIEVITKPAVDLGRDTTVCDSVALLIGPSAPINTSILWNTGETFSPIVIRTAGYYRINLTNVCGVSSDDKIVGYTDCDSPVAPGQGLKLGCLFIPTAFTPNGDSRNDRFKVVSVCPVQRYHILILNRRGQVVYEDHNISNSWDGQFKGVPAAMDTYFYLIEFLRTNVGNVPDKIEGDLLLVR